MPIAETVAPDISRDEYARWIALQHLDTDPRLSVVYYLPTGAPAREVRLVEVNQSIGVLNRSYPLEVLDFSVDHEGVERFLVLVADVAPFEWEAITNRELAAPRGWSLESLVEIRLTETD